MKEGLGETSNTENSINLATPAPKTRGRSRWVFWGGITLFSLASLLTFGCSNQVTAKSTPTPTPEIVPTPVSNLRTYTWKGTNIDVTTKCSTGDPTFDAEVKGQVAAGQGNDVWTTLSDEKRTILVSYQAGNNQEPTNVAFNLNDQAISTRGQNPITLRTSDPTATHGFEIKIYTSPPTPDYDSIPDFFNLTPVGSARFATDCR